jgi:YD repeat-containing protein
LGTSNDNTYTFAYTNAHQVASDAASVAGWKWQSSVTGTVPYGAANNLNQYPSVNGQTISYDTRGNMTGDGVFTYTYDAENRMLTANKTGTNATFVYDPLGRRVKKQINTARNWYLSDGADEIAEYTGITAATLAYRYVPGPAIDQPIAMVTAAGAKTYFHTDKRGSVIVNTPFTDFSSTGLRDNRTVCPHYW